MSGHRYLSTACLHGIHEHCQAKTNLEGEPKEPGTCKWCAARCVCDYVAPDGTPCHPREGDLMTTIGPTSTGPRG